MEVLDNIHDDRTKFRYYLNPLGNLAILSISLSMIAFLFRMYAVFMLYKLFPSNGRMLDYSESLQLQWWANAVDAASVVYLFLFVVSLIPFFMWLYRAYFNLDVIKLRGLSVTPGWAVGWFFIPFANLYYSVVVLNDVFKGTKHRDIEEPINNSIEYQNVPPLGVIWLILRLVGAIMSYMGLANFIKNPDISKFDRAIMFEFLSMAMILVSGAIIVYFIHSVTKRQNQAKNF